MTMTNLYFFLDDRNSYCPAQVHIGAHRQECREEASHCWQIPTLAQKVSNDSTVIILFTQI